MPRSKRRKPHHDQSRQGGVEKTGKYKSAVPVSVVFCGLIGVGIAYFGSDGSAVWLLLGLVLGAIGGYLFGKQFDRSFSKK